MSARKAEIAPSHIVAPMIGGVITATTLGLIVLPVIYGLALQVEARLAHHRSARPSLARDPA